MSLQKNSCTKVIWGCTRVCVCARVCMSVWVGVCFVNV